MAAARTCEACGGMIPVGAPAGLCPKCILVQAVRPESAHPDTTLRFGAGPTAADPLTMLLAERLPQFEVLGRLGSGGMAVVYRARQRDLDREVALKLILPGMVTHSLVRRFQHEAEALGRLQHPGIAQIYLYGTIDTEWGPQPYFALELIGGVDAGHAPTLIAYADHQRLDIRQRLQLLAKVAEAVHHAHQKGIIHRDLKPGNILVDETGQPKVLDFGVARLTDQDIKSTTQHTDMGQLIGTLAYMSPEQAGGDPTELDIRSDVYALGVIGYELLSGRLPYDLRRRMIHEAVRVIREEDPSRISSLNRTLRGDIETILLKSLAKEKDRRYQSAAEFATDIQRYLHDQPVAARAPSTWYQLRKFVRRNRVLTAATAAMMVALVGGIITTSWQASRASREAVRATQAEGVAAREAARAKETAESAMRRLYATDMVLAHKSWMEGRSARASALLEQHRPQLGESDLRAWEWYYLQSLLHQDVRAFGDGTAPIQAVAWSPTGDRVAVAADDGVIRIWDPHTGTLRQRIEGHEGAVCSLSWDAQSERLVSGGQDRLVRIWDLETPADSYVLSGHEGWLYAVAWSPNGRWIASAGEDRTARIWDASNREQVQALTPELEPITAVAWAPSGDRLVTGHRRLTDAERFVNDGQERLLLWEPLTGRELSRIRLSAGTVFSVSWRPGSHELLVGQEIGTYGVRDVGSSNAVEQIEYTVKAVRSVAWSPDGTRYAAAGEIGLVRVRDAASHATVLTLAGHTDTVTCVAWSLDGRLLVSGTAGGTLRLWDTTQHGDSLTKLPCRNSVSSVRWAPDSRRLAVTDGRNSFEVWDGVSGETMMTLTGHQGRVRCAEWSPNGDLLASGGSDHTVRTWDAQTGEMRSTLRGHTSPILSLAWAPAGDRLASHSGQDWRSTRVIVWDLLSHEPIWTIPRPYKYSRRIDWSSRDLLAAPSSDQDVLIWNMKRNEELRPFMSRWYEVNAAAVAWRGDGRRLAVCDRSGKILVWDQREREPLVLEDAHTSGIWDIAWSPDGTRIATASWDQTVKVLDAKTGAEVFAFPEDDHPLLSVAWSPDGRRLATGGKGAEVLIRHAAKGYEMEERARDQELAKLDETFGELRHSADSSQRLAAMEFLAASYVMLGRRDKAHRLLEELCEFRRNAPVPEFPRVLEAMQALAGSHADANRMAQAVLQQEQALELCRKVLGSEHLRSLSAMQALADYYADAGRADQAITMEEEALVLFRKTLGPGHADTLSAMDRVVSACIRFRGADEAVGFLEKVLATRRQALGAQHIDTMATIRELAWNHRQAGRLEKARGFQEELLAYHRNELGPDDPRTLIVVDGLGDICLSLGRVDEGLELLAASSTVQEFTLSVIRHAALQVWFNRNAEHASTCAWMLGWAENKPEFAQERVVKIVCLRPVGDPHQIDAILALARRAASAKGTSFSMFQWAQLALGMAEYRSGHFPEADEAFDHAMQAAPGQIAGLTAGVYHVMSLYRQGDTAVARQRFAELEKQISPLPGEQEDLYAQFRDDLILWLACKEARALLGP